MEGRIPSMELKPIPINPQDFLDLHAAIGMALWHGNGFEFSLTHFITRALKLPPSRAEQEVRHVLEEMQGKTLGQLIAELRKANSTNSVTSFEARVNRFLEERNWLVHHSWRDHRTVLFTPESLPPLLNRLDALADEGQALQEVFQELLHALTLSQGITQESVDAKKTRLLRSQGVIE